VTLGIFLGRLPVKVFKLLNDRQSEFRESSEPIMYKLSTEKFQAIPEKIFYIISMRMDGLLRFLKFENNIKLPVI